MSMCPEVALFSGSSPSPYSIGVGRSQQTSRVCRNSIRYAASARVCRMSLIHGRTSVALIEICRSAYVIVLMFLYIIVLMTFLIIHVVAHVFRRSGSLLHLPHRRRPSIKSFHRDTTRSCTWHAAPRRHVVWRRVRDAGTLWRVSDSGLVSKADAVGLVSRAVRSFTGPKKTGDLILITNIITVPELEIQGHSGTSIGW